MPMLSWLKCTARQYALGMMWDKYVKLHGEPKLPLPNEAVSFADYILDRQDELKALEGWLAAYKPPQSANSAQP